MRPFIQTFYCLTLAILLVFTVTVTKESFVHAKSPQIAAPPKVRLPDEQPFVTSIPGCLPTREFASSGVTLGP